MRQKGLRVRDALNAINGVDQTAGNSITLRFCSVFIPQEGYLRAQINFPFVCKNTNYSVTLGDADVFDVGTFSFQLWQKTQTGISITSTTSVSTPSYTAYVGWINVTITFA